MALHISSSSSGRTFFFSFGKSAAVLFRFAAVIGVFGIKRRPIGMSALRGASSGRGRFSCAASSSTTRLSVGRSALTSHHSCHRRVVMP